MDAQKAEKAVLGLGTELARPNEVAHSFTTPVMTQGHHPCPFSGILDMSDVPLRQHRRSFYSEDGNVYISPPVKDGMVTSEPPLKEELVHCAIDSEGLVLHGEKCVLKGVARKTTAETTGRFMLQVDMREDVESEPRFLPESPSAVPMRKWSSHHNTMLGPPGAAGEIFWTFRMFKGGQ